MIDKKVLAYSQKMLSAWLGFEAGCSNPDYFGAQKGTLGLELQQVPQEYALLLDWFRKQNFESYLELGVGRGGSFLLNVMFQPNLKSATCVDNSEYWKQDQHKSIEDKVDWLKANKEDCLVSFIPHSTDKAFEIMRDVENFTIGGQRHPREEFDCIFIDAGHDYESVKKDFDNSLKHIKNSGFIIFHDINSSSCPGVQRIWKEVGVIGNGFNDFTQAVVDTKTFIHGNNCGIGIICVIERERDGEEVFENGKRYIRKEGKLVEVSVVPVESIKTRVIYSEPKEESGILEKGLVSDGGITHQNPRTSIPKELMPLK